MIFHSSILPFLNQPDVIQYTGSWVYSTAPTLSLARGSLLLDWIKIVSTQLQRTIESSTYILETFNSRSASQLRLVLTRPKEPQIARLLSPINPQIRLPHIQLSMITSIINSKITHQQWTPHTYTNAYHGQVKFDSLNSSQEQVTSTSP